MRADTSFTTKNPWHFISQICRVMKWTYQEYQQQPAYLIETLKIQLETEAEASKRNGQHT